MHCSPLLPDGSSAESTGIYLSLPGARHWCDAHWIHQLGLDLILLIKQDFSRLCVSLVWASEHDESTPFFQIWMQTLCLICWQEPVNPGQLEINKTSQFAFFFHSKFVKWSPWLPHSSRWCPSLISNVILHPEMHERTHLWENRVWQKGRAGCCCWGLFWNTVLQLCTTGLGFCYGCDCKANNKGFYLPEFSRRYIAAVKAWLLVLGRAMGRPLEAF